ncbi:helix-turn-helix domain-containing protein [Cohnella yongneupensis]|uniref:Helix-turn-helix domain-containing protein n=1 Tax=Cohnella yongneupensis TaxID=425006 RepID=A0ABW0QX77_9BACL
MLLSEAAAREFGYSPFHFHRLFQAWTGETFGKYVRVRRLANAARELRRGQVKRLRKPGQVTAMQNPWQNDSHKRTRCFRIVPMLPLMKNE